MDRRAWWATVHGVAKSRTLTGDLDSPELPGFLETPQAHCDLITVPHHGGRSRTTEPLLKRLTPDYAAVSEVAGRLSAETLREWQTWDPNLAVLCTGNCGAIEVRIEKRRDESRFTLKPYRYPAR